MSVLKPYLRGNSSHFFNSFNETLAEIPDNECETFSSKVCGVEQNLKPALSNKRNCQMLTSDTNYTKSKI